MGHMPKPTLNLWYGLLQHHYRFHLQASIANVRFSVSTISYRLFFSVLNAPKAIGEVYLVADADACHDSPPIRDAARGSWGSAMAFLHSTETSPASISIGQQNTRLGAAGLRVGGRYRQAPLAWMAPANQTL